jgi:flagellar hook-length control protein FliK
MVPMNANAAIAFLTNDKIVNPRKTSSKGNTHTTGANQSFDVLFKTAVKTSSSKNTSKTQSSSETFSLAAANGSGEVFSRVTSRKTKSSKSANDSSAAENAAITLIEIPPECLVTGKDGKIHLDLESLPDETKKKLGIGEENESADIQIAYVSEEEFQKILDQANLNQTHSNQDNSSTESSSLGEDEQILFAQQRIFFTQFNPSPVNTNGDGSENNEEKISEQGSQNKTPKSVTVGLPNTVPFNQFMEENAVNSTETEEANSKDRANLKKQDNQGFNPNDAIKRLKNTKPSEQPAPELHGKKGVLKESVKSRVEAAQDSNETRKSTTLKKSTAREREIESAEKKGNSSVSQSTLKSERTEKMEESPESEKPENVLSMQIETAADGVSVHQGDVLPVSRETEGDNPKGEKATGEKLSDTREPETKKVAAFALSKQSINADESDDQSSDEQTGKIQTSGEPIKDVRIIKAQTSGEPIREGKLSNVQAAPVQDVKATKAQAAGAPVQNENDTESQVSDLQTQDSLEAETQTAVDRTSNARMEAAQKTESQRLDDSPKAILVQSEVDRGERDAKSSKVLVLARAASESREEKAKSLETETEKVKNQNDEASASTETDAIVESDLLKKLLEEYDKRNEHGKTDSSAKAQIAAAAKGSQPFEMKKQEQTLLQQQLINNQNNAVLEATNNPQSAQPGADGSQTQLEPAQNQSPSQPQLSQPSSPQSSAPVQAAPVSAPASEPAQAGSSTQHYAEKVAEIQDAAAKQIVRGVQGSIGSERSHITMRLVPETLGRIHIQMTMDNGALTAQITAQKESTQVLLQQSVNSLRSAFEEQGIKVDRLVVNKDTLDLKQQDQGRHEEAQERSAKNRSSYEQRSGQNGQNNNGKQSKPQFSLWSDRMKTSDYFM